MAIQSTAAPPAPPSPPPAAPTAPHRIPEPPSSPTHTADVEVGDAEHDTDSLVARPLSTTLQNQGRMIVILDPRALQRARVCQCTILVVTPTIAALGATFLLYFSYRGVHRHEYGTPESQMGACGFGVAIALVFTASMLTYRIYRAGPQAFV